MYDDSALPEGLAIIGFLLLIMSPVLFIYGISYNVIITLIILILLDILAILMLKLSKEMVDRRTSSDIRVW